MKKIFIMAILNPIICLSTQAQKPNYPITKEVNAEDTYFGTTIKDPYRWLENDTSKETAEWVKQENKFTTSYLEKIPFRNVIKERLEKIWNYPKFSVPTKEGNYYFFYMNTGVQNQSILYIQDKLNGVPAVFIDPNTLSSDGTVALGQLEASNDGKYMAYCTSKAGSDWEDIFIKEIPSGKQLNDHIKWAKFTSIAWKGDGFYYSKYDAPEKGREFSNKNEYHKIYFHKLGTPQESDILVYEDLKFPLRNYAAQTTTDEKYLIIYETEATDNNNMYVKNLNIPNSEFVAIYSDFKSDNVVIENIGDKLIVKTSENANKNKLVLVDLADFKNIQKQDLIDEKEKEVLTSAHVIGNKIFTIYMKDASNKAYIFSVEGTFEKELALPDIGTIGSFTGKKNDTIAFYNFTSFIFPTTIYAYDITKGESQLFKKSAIDFNPEEYITKQIFYTSKDGTKIPMFIVHKKGLELNGDNPTILYGYGGFNISITPSFATHRLILLENNGILAIANIRGGGEYGSEWHKAGTKLQKQNVFDDFIGAAEYLIKEKYTNPEKLAIQGGSNGGLLVGACMTQRPDLFKVALPAVGVMDMLRFHKFTIGWAWVGDYGSSEDATQFKNLLNYSPLHNLKKGAQYPATLVTTADHDDRVVPAHSFKFIATLQYCQSGPNPTLIRIDTNAGHGAGKPTSKQIEEYTDIYSFLFYNMGLDIRY